MAFSVSTTQLILTGAEPAILSLEIDGALIDFTEYVDSLANTTAGTPYTASVSGYSTEEAAFYPPVTVQDLELANAVQAGRAQTLPVGLGQSIGAATAIQRSTAQPLTLTQFHNNTAAAALQQGTAQALAVNQAQSNTAAAATQSATAQALEVGQGRLLAIAAAIQAEFATVRSVITSYDDTGLRNLTMHEIKDTYTLTLI